MQEDVITITPGAVIRLGGDPQLVHNREPELPVREIARQTDILDGLMRQLPAMYQVDVSEPATCNCLRGRCHRLSDDESESGWGAGSGGRW